MANKSKNNTAYVKQLIVSACQKYGVNPYLALGLARQESGFGHYDNKGNIKKSPKGALGVFQLMPATAKGLKVDPTDLEDNIEGGVKYLAQQLKTFGGDIDKTLAAYNAGPNAVRKYNGIPPYRETQNYVKAIKGNMEFMQHQKDTRNLIASNYAINNNGDTITGAASNIGGNMPEVPQVNNPAYMNINPLSYQNLGRLYQTYRQDPTAQFAAMTATGQNPYAQRNIMINNLINTYFTGGGIEYNDLINSLRGMGVPEQTLATIPQIDQTKRVRSDLDVYNQYTGTTPEQQQAMQAQQLQALQQLQAGMNGGQNMYQLMNQYYDQARQAAQMPTGYQIDPAAVQRDINARNWRAGFHGNWDQVSTPEQDAERLYKARIASQQGMTYDNYLQQKQNELALAQKQIENALAVQKQYGVVDQKTLEAYNNVIGAQQDIAKARGEDIRNIITTNRTGASDLNKQSVSNYPTLITNNQNANQNVLNTLVGNANAMGTGTAGYAGDVLGAQSRVNAAQLGANADIYGSNISARGQDINYALGQDKNAIDAMKAQQAGQGNAEQNAVRNAQAQLNIKSTFPQLTDQEVAAYSQMNPQQQAMFWQAKAMGQQQ